MLWDHCETIIVLLALSDTIHFATVWLTLGSHRPHLPNDGLLLPQPGWLVADALVLFGITIAGALLCRWRWRRGAERHWWQYLPLWPLKQVDVRAKFGRNVSLAFDVLLPLRIGQLIVSILAAADVIGARMALLLFVTALPYSVITTTYAALYDRVIPRCFFVT